MSNLVIIPNDKIQLVKDQICKNASDNELQLFISTCNRTGLDPFAKQCWAVKRWDSSLKREVLAFQTGVDGFRVIAERSNKYAGQVGPFWCGEDGAWKDVWLSDKAPVAAKVGVLRTDFKEPLWAVAKFSSYAAKNKNGDLTPFWVKMPELMIAKVAESLALRKAFPQDLSGIYSSEEMDQAQEKDITPLSTQTNPVVTPGAVGETNCKIAAQSSNELQQVQTAGPINHAPQTRLDSYKMKFNFGTFQSGKTFKELGAKDTTTLLNSIKTWKLQKESRNEKIPSLCEEFIELAGEWLEKQQN